MVYTLYKNQTLYDKTYLPKGGIEMAENLQEAGIKN